MTEKLTLGLSLTVIGMSITFLILFLLQIMMNAEAYVFNRSHAVKKPRAVPDDTSTEQSVTASTPAQLPASGDSPSVISPQVIAAIMGAITANTGRPVQSFRLVSVRQAWDLESSTAWSLNNRLDIINRRNSFYSKGGAK